MGTRLQRLTVCCSSRIQFVYLRCRAPVVHVASADRHVLFCGALQALSEKLPFLSFMNDLNPAVKSLIQGLLPTIFLAALMALLPVIIRGRRSSQHIVHYSCVALGIGYQQLICVPGLPCAHVASCHYLAGLGI